MNYHKPVLFDECIEALVQTPEGVYVDCTFGGGGHSRGILEKLNENGKLFAFDQDLDAVKNQFEDSRFQLILSNFRFIKNQLKFYGITQVDGVLADLGVSSHQFDTATRGFSTRFEGRLDMRMNQNQSKSAWEVVNQYPEKDLGIILKNYGEIKQGFKWANIIATARKNTPIDTTQDLKEVLSPVIPKHKENKLLAQLFQALRIEVNDELKALEDMLMQMEDIIKPEGRLVVISYHSLEDRLVKNYIKKGMFQGEPERDLYGNWYAPFKPLQSKVILASEEEVEENPRARSAKLRIGIRNHG
ncbi:16S rRNA (cytosine(1402)-N(4))-methyltransferase RsmH [Ornithobacterium rhinotracheale]|uniref:16S rRNA (cytosine(1402)-N(4))-methyltransferase RsmH n=1 Tax=Ornithobacterium rhinotracheale TaxID=28251 RepID=UPI00129C35B1|nr:16S rRNA (cytosine(1402)-N(4))-methyltransferase RsmH [Ornithobacterium rhinotracheale]MRJ08810.1 16S rRNA (cytosine(1402)-N(4))-methyltransferase RsmH [Ornithobacterium rhinotracheale]UOH77693.1 16S rRNA (cytosine(1402)-N(4))-methyltransferase RsmH [Ornithobacterium rhinotracheale]